MGLQPMDKRKTGPTGPVVKNIKQEGEGEFKQNEWYLCEECFSTAVLKDRPSEGDWSELELKDKDRLS